MKQNKTVIMSKETGKRKEDIMFDASLNHYLTDRVVDGADQIYVGIDNKTGRPALAVPGVEHALVGAYYYELSDDEYKLARADIQKWYAALGSKIAQKAA